ENTPCSDTETAAMTHPAQCIPQVDGAPHGPNRVVGMGDGRDAKEHEKGRAALIDPELMHETVVSAHDRADRRRDQLELLQAIGGSLIEIREGDEHSGDTAQLSRPIEIAALKPAADR